MSELPAWTIEYGYDDPISKQLWTLIHVPSRPYALYAVLETFERAVAAVSEVVDYSDAKTLSVLSAAAHAIRDSLSERADLPDVHAERTAVAGYYDRYPLYGLLFHPYPDPSREGPYLLLVGVMILLSPIVTDQRQTVRYATYCRAVRHIAAQAVHPDGTDHEILLDALLPALRLEEHPGTGIQRLALAARGTRHSRHADALRAAWNALVAQAAPRARDGHRGGRRGYQWVLGIARGAHHAHLVVPSRGVGADWSALVHVSDRAESDGPGRAGEAAADAGTPGSVRGAEPTDDYSVPYYDRATMYRHSRHIQSRRRTHAQDTMLMATVWTPQQTAEIVHAVQALAGSDEEELRHGSALLLTILVTGVDADTVATLEYRKELSDALGDSRMVVTADGWMAWRPPSGQSALPPPKETMRDVVCPAGRWVVAPRPGLLVGLDDVLAQVSYRNRRAALDRALRHVRHRLRLSITPDQIRRNWWGWLAHVRGQPVVASAMTGYVRPSCVVPMHYAHISPDVQCETYRQAYTAFALAVQAEYAHAGRRWVPEWSQTGWQSRPPTTVGYGSPIVPRTEAMEVRLRRCVERPGGDGRSRTDSINRLTTALNHVVVLTCGLRPTRVRSGHAALILRGHVILSDKDTPRYSKARPVHVSDALRRRLDELWRQRQRLLYTSGLYGVGALPEFPPVPITRDDLIAECARCIPGLSYVRSDPQPRLQLERPHGIRVMGLDLDLPPSWPRHWMRSAMLEAGVDDQAANVRMGHACIGHDPFDRDSCMRPGAATLRALKPLEQTLQALLTKLARRV